MRRAPLASPAALAALLLATACSSGGSSTTATHPTTAPSPSSPAASPTSGGGLLGTIDRARLLAACENIRNASTMVEAGQSAAAYLTAAADQLEKPPRDPAAIEFATNLRAAVAAGDEAAAVRDGLQFCRLRQG